jgi:hypothetical protein
VNRRNENILNTPENAKRFTDAVNEECDCSGKPCGTQLFECFHLKATGGMTGHQLDVWRHDLEKVVYLKVRRKGEKSKHMHKGSAMFYTRIPRNLLPTAAQTDDFKGDHVYPFLSLESKASVRAAREVYNQRTNTTDKWRNLKAIMNEYITTGEGTVEQALVWAAANVRRDSPGADVLYTLTPHDADMLAAAAAKRAAAAAAAANSI